MQRLQQLFASGWIVDKKSFANLLSVITPCILSGQPDNAEKLLEKSYHKVMALGPTVCDSYDFDDVSLPENSVAVITLMGMLYAWDTDWLIRCLRKAEENPRICGVVLAIDGPGGQSTRIDVAADIIRNFSKPVATAILGNMCSAHFWIGTSARRTFATSQLCTVGSVGVYQEYLDLTEYYKAQGIDYREIYPATSDLKNEESRAISDRNDESLIKTQLEEIHRLFATTVADNLGITYDPELELFRGRVFSASAAVAAGYVDQFGTLEDAVVWVLAQAANEHASV